VSRDKLSTLAQRIEWLLQHRSFLIGKLGLSQSKKLVAVMKYDGLIAKSTYWCDCSHGLDEAIKQAKIRWYAEHNGREITP
jgi:hypothetical protein